MRTPDELVAAARECVADLDLTYPDYSVRYRVWRASIHGLFYRLVLLWAQRHRPGVAALLGQLVVDTADILARHGPALAQWLGSLHRSRGWYCEEYFIDACWGRSAYEIARTLYSGTTAEAALAELEIHELDETLAEQNAEHGQVVLPPEIPLSHSWWFMATDTKGLPASVARDLARIAGRNTFQQAFEIGNVFKAMPYLAAGRGEPGIEGLIATMVAETANALASSEEALGSWLHRRLAEAQQPTRADFLTICWERSGYELAREFYRGTAAEPVLASLDIPQIDEALASHADEHGQLELPREIPPSHSWWLFRPR